MELPAARNEFFKASQEAATEHARLHWQMCLRQRTYAGAADSGHFSVLDLALSFLVGSCSLLHSQNAALVWERRCGSSVS